MQEQFLKFNIDLDKTVLTSTSLFYKTENFINKTKYISSLDRLLIKLCEGIISRFKDLEKLDKNLNFVLDTIDKNYVFRFAFGKKIKSLEESGENSLNEKDIIFYDFLEEETKRSQDLSVMDYLVSLKELSVLVKGEREFLRESDFKKLYLISSNGLNLPKLSDKQREIVETVDKNILVQGVAGSGKTNICIDKILFTASKNFKGKILYSTFSRGLLNDTKLKVNEIRNEFEELLNASKSNKLVYLDNNKKKCIENRLGKFCTFEDEGQIFSKIESIIFNLSNKVEYLLIEDLYKQKFGDCVFASENYFIKEYCKNFTNYQLEKSFNKLYKYSKEIIYKEIYGMIFGFCDKTLGLEMLSLNDYILKRENSFNRTECEAIYQIAKDYKSHLEKNNLIDNNLASRKLLADIPSDFDFVYSLTILDEVQDYTQVNLCLFKRLSLKLFCVGDAMQMINPSYFNFGYLKNLLFEEDLTEVKELKQNFRNTVKIGEIIDNLSEINRQEFGTHSFLLKGESVDNGIKSTAVYVENGKNFINDIAKSKFDNFTIVVSSSKEKQELLKQIKNQEVLTVSEIKGLERNTVVTLNLLSDNLQNWKLLEQNKVNHKSADENSIFRYYYNLFYVGLTRSKQNLFVVENVSIPQFVKFFNQNFSKLDSKKAIAELTKLIKFVEFTQVEAENRVKEFIKLEQFDNARFTAGKIKEDKNRIEALRNIEVNENFIRFGKYREAGIKFWEYGMLKQAKEQFTLSGDGILIELIEVLSKDNKTDLSVDIVNYFLDVKDNTLAQQFIVETLNRDVENLKSKFSALRRNFKKGRK